jgi:hypothetical protein
MQIQLDIIQKFGLYDRTHTRLREVFNEFCGSAKRPSEDPRFPVKSLTFSSVSSTRFDATLGDTTLQFKFTSEYNPDGSIIGRVSCYKQTGRIKDPEVCVGSFTFKHTGQTEFDGGEDGPADINYFATEIVLHLFKAALTAGSAA